VHKPAPCTKSTPGLSTLMRHGREVSRPIRATFGACGLVALPLRPHHPLRRQENAAVRGMVASRDPVHCGPGCAGPWCFPKQAMVHEFEVAYGAVAAACAIGAVATFLRDRLAGRRGRSTRRWGGQASLRSSSFSAPIPVSADVIYQVAGSTPRTGPMRALGDGS